MPISLTAVIATFNRAEMLRGAIQSLCEQELAADRFEIVVIDNASTDDTRAVTEAFIKETPGRQIRYVYESRPGLSHARNRGYVEARGAWVAYLDDDARAKADWLKEADRIITGIGPEVVCIGGPYGAFFTAAAPAWFKDSYCSMSMGSEARYLGKGEYVSGSNMIWRRACLEAFDGFRVDLGVKGYGLALGEEPNLFERVRKRDATAAVYYSPALRVDHWVDPAKMHLTYQLRRSFAAGQALQSWLVESHAAGRNTRRFALALAAMGMQTLLLPIRWFGHRHWQNWVVEDVGKVASEAGILCASLGWRPMMKGRKPINKQ